MAFVKNVFVCIALLCFFVFLRNMAELFIIEPAMELSATFDTWVSGGEVLNRARDRKCLTTYAT